jgi:hypothetical protein
MEGGPAHVATVDVPAFLAGTMIKSRELTKRSPAPVFQAYPQLAGDAESKNCSI